MLSYNDRGETGGREENRVLCDNQGMETNSVSVSRGMNQEEVMYAHNGILHSFKKGRNAAICNCMDEPGGHYGK